MFDFDKIAEGMAAVGELDTLLRAILAEQRTTNMLLGILIADTRSQFGQSQFSRAAIDGAANIILRDAHEIANGPDART